MLSQHMHGIAELTYNCEVCQLISRWFRRGLKVAMLTAVILSLEE